ncbi:MAG: methionyl-tRNA formyltransferase [Aestuariivirgaceae bacterium]
MSLRLIFMGTPEFAVPALEAVISAGHRILAVYTRPPRQAGRGLHERFSPVHQAAVSAGLPVETPATFRSEEVLKSFRDKHADAAVVVAYGMILPKPVLEAPGLGAYNIHASLLPRWRGAAPLSRAIMAGDRTTGVTIMRMTEGLDEGPICLMRTAAIGENETAGELHDRLARFGADLILGALADLERGTLPMVPQSFEGVTYAAKISKAETHIDFTRSAQEVLNHIHGLSPHPGAWAAAAVGGGRQRVKMLKAELAKGSGAQGTIIDDDFAIACADGAIRPLILQREGRAAMQRAEFLRGLSLRPGARLS